MDMLSTCGITYKEMYCIGTDTEVTMVKAACLFCSTNTEQASTTISWHGCIDQLLNLVTKLAFKNNEESHGTMSKARDLVTHFSSFSQA